MSKEQQTQKTQRHWVWKQAKFECNNESELPRVDFVTAGQKTKKLHTHTIKTKNKRQKPNGNNNHQHIVFYHRYASMIRFVLCHRNCLNRCHALASKYKINNRNCDTHRMFIVWIIVFASFLFSSFLFELPYFTATVIGVP